MNKFKAINSFFLRKSILVCTLFFLFSCADEKNLDLDYSFTTAIDVEQEPEDFKEIEFDTFKDLDLGFYKGTVWIKLELKNYDKHQSLVVMCNDLINRNYRFYKLDTLENKLKRASFIVNLETHDHRTHNNSKPNFQIDLSPNENATYFISTSSDGRILQATPIIMHVSDYEIVSKQPVILDSIFYGVITILLLINIYYWRLLKNKVYYPYGFYIICSCLMYLFVEGRLYGLGLSHHVIDHAMFLSIRLWTLSSVLFTFKFLDIKVTKPKFFKFIQTLLVVSLGGATLYQFIFYESSIAFLHEFENVLGFIWIVLGGVTIGISFKHRREESKYYLITYSLFIFFICAGLVDSHAAILPGDPFSYFKVGTVFEFIGFTYFITRLLKKKLKATDLLELELEENRERLRVAAEQLENQQEKQKLKKSDLVGIFKLVENSLSSDKEWKEFKNKFDELNPDFLKNILEKHDDLTKSEIRLLTLMKVGYSQKEIASILNIAPDSVKKAKSRARKKMGLESSTELTDYLLAF